MMCDSVTDKTYKKIFFVASTFFLAELRINL